MFSATAFICLYNEADIIRWTLKHLMQQGVGVYIIDNWSADGSAEIARSFPLVGYEKFPAEGPSKYYSWEPLLCRVEQLAEQSHADWCIHYDADEIRRSSRRSETLLEGIHRVDACGYTAINFDVYHFLPVDDTYVGDPENHFQYYWREHMDAQMRQTKAWKNLGIRVDIHSTGGHYASFGRCKVFPENFILKHYPLRTAAQAARKVLTERVGRYDPRERSKGWHVQYLDVARTQRWIVNPDELQKWDDKCLTE